MFSFFSKYAGRLLIIEEITAYYTYFQDYAIPNKKIMMSQNHNGITTTGTGSSNVQYLFKISTSIFPKTSASSGPWNSIFLQNYM
jgi:hypothetical protein